MTGAAEFHRRVHNHPCQREQEQQVHDQIDYVRYRPKPLVLVVQQGLHHLITRMAKQEERDQWKIRRRNAGVVRQDTPQKAVWLIRYTSATTIIPDEPAARHDSSSSSAREANSPQWICGWDRSGPRRYTPKCTRASSSCRCRQLSAQLKLGGSAGKSRGAGSHVVRV